MKLDAPAGPAPPSTRADRLTAAAARSYGVIQAISSCGRSGLLSEESVLELNDSYSCRVEPLLQTASLLQRTAVVVRSLVAAADRLRRVSR